MRYHSLTVIFIFASILAPGQNKSYEKGLKAFDAKDYTKAFQLLKPAADSGDSMAEFVIGFCYLNPELNIKNDLLGEHYLISAAEKYNPRAMGLLAMYYFQKGMENEELRIQSLIWAEIAGAYDPAFNATTTRFLIRNYLSEQALHDVEKNLKEKKKKYDKISLDEFYRLNKRARAGNQNTEKAKIPENKYGLIENPYADWVYRWKIEGFECDTMYYTAQIDAKIIDSTIHHISLTRSFPVHFLYRDDKLKLFSITKDEQDYLINELEQLKSHRWLPGLFPYSRCLEQHEVQATFDITENLSTEKEKNMCSIVYTFSKPIFIRNGSIALYLDQKRYRTNYTQLEFDFYKRENNRWEKIAAAYTYYESEKK